MGTTKYPILDKDFTIKMMGCCKDDEERGLITVLDLTGMHISAVCGLSPSNMIKQGSQVVLRWQRPKTQKTLERFIPKDSLDIISKFLAMKRKSRRWYHELVKRIGHDAGYDGISPMTFRHNQCIKALDSGSTIWEIPHIMGCTLDVAVRNYSKKKELEQLRE